MLISTLAHCITSLFLLSMLNLISNYSRTTFCWTQSETITNAIWCKNCATNGKGEVYRSMQKEREGIPIFFSISFGVQWFQSMAKKIHYSYTQKILQSTYKKKSSNTSKSSLITLQKLNLVSDTSFGLVQGQFAHSRCMSFFFWLFLFL